MWRQALREQQPAPAEGICGATRKPVWRLELRVRQRQLRFQVLFGVSLRFFCIAQAKACRLFTCTDRSCSRVPAAETPKRIQAPFCSPVSCALISAWVTWTNERRVICNTCGQAKATAAATPAPACVASSVADSRAVLYSSPIGSVDAAPSMSEVAASEASTVRGLERHAAADAAQPGFVDFAALSRRIFATSAAASDAQPLPESRTYDAAAAADTTAIKMESGRPPAKGGAQNLASATSLSQRPKNCTYEAAAALTESFDDGTGSTARQRTTAAGGSHARNIPEARLSAAKPRTENSWKPAKLSGVAPVSATKHQLGARARHVTTQPEASAARQRGTATIPRHLATSEDDNSATDSDADVLRARRSRQRPECASVSRQPA